MKGSQDAVTSTYAFIIAVGIMLGSVATVYSATNDIASQGTVLEAEQVNLQTEAANLKQIILGTPGVAGDGPWDESVTPSADSLDRLGLLEPDLSGIQFEKLQNLRLAPREANDTDNFANYEEVAADLGLVGKGLDFHIRAKPTLRSVEEVVNDPSLRDKNLKITYIGNVSSTYSGSEVDDGLEVDDFACEAAPTSSPSWRYSVNVTNNGQQETQFFLVWDITNSGTLTRQDQSALIPAGDSAIIHVDVEASSDVACDSSTTVELDILDPIQLLRTESLSNPAIGTTPSAATGQFYTAAGTPYADISGNKDDVRISYYGDVFLDDDNDPITSHGLTLEVREGTDPSGTIVHSDSGNVDSNVNKQYFEFDAENDLDGPGEYTAYLEHVPSGIVSTQRILVINGEPGAFVPAGASGQTSYDEDPAMAIEIQFLADIAEQFCPTYFDDKTNSSIGADWGDRCSEFKSEDPQWSGDASTVQPGDVFPDLQQELWAMESRLLHADGTPRYDIVNTVVVGSNVAHNSMTSNNFGGPLETWVLGGGTLVVFGSPGQSTQWLQDLFHAGQTSSSGGISAPDVSHPLLSIPEPLAYDEYATSGKGWKYTGGADEHFTDVVQQGGTPTTAISDPGDFGEGTIVLTSWLPYDLFGTGPGTSNDEGLRLMFNFLMQNYRDLFLDYGPPIPDGVPVIPAFGLSQVDHPDLGRVTLTVTFFVFPSSG